MNKTHHKSLEITDAAQAAVHKKIGSLDRESLVRYFADRQNAFRYPASLGEEQTLVRESSLEGKAHSK
ncbi:MAG: hypothetical protein JJU29_23940 [Verrucomicrobia bacterium]|nr:hypothetical protein [Verrucomicrobiota bacterium]